MYEPFPPLYGNPFGRIVSDIDEVNEGMGPVLRMIEAWHVNHIVNNDAQAMQLFECIHSRQVRLRPGNAKENDGLTCTPGQESYPPTCAPSRCCADHRRI